MENSQFSLEVKCLKLIGLHRHQLENFWKTKICMYLVMASPVFFSLFGVIAYAVENYKNLIAVAEASGIIFTGYIAMSKLVTFFCSSEKFFKIMDDIKKLSKKGEID
jgi:hypothetical protein